MLPPSFLSRLAARLLRLPGVPRPSPLVMTRPLLLTVMLSLSRALPPFSGFSRTLERQAFGAESCTRSTYTFSSYNSIDLHVTFTLNTLFVVPLVVTIIRTVTHILDICPNCRFLDFVCKCNKIIKIEKE